MSFSEGRKFLNALPEIQQDLPISPRLFHEIFSAAKDNALASMDKLGRIIEQDQGLAVKILSMANSAYYGLQSQVVSVKRAVVVLGLKELRKMLLLIGIRGLESRLLPGVLDIQALWKHQVEVAHVAQSLTRTSDLADPEEMFTAGLLHDVGKLIIAIHEPRHWKTVERLAREKECALHRAEDAYWGLDHALIGAMTLKTWFLPISLTEPINWHHSPDQAQEFLLQARLLRLADALVHVHQDAIFTVYSAWDRDADALRLKTEDTLTLARETLESDHTASFLQGFGLNRT